MEKLNEENINSEEALRNLSDKELSDLGFSNGLIAEIKQVLAERPNSAKHGPNEIIEFTY